MARVTARRVRGGLGVTSWALEQLGTGGHRQLTVKVVAAARIMNGCFCKFDLARHCFKGLLKRILLFRS